MNWKSYAVRIAVRRVVRILVGLAVLALLLLFGAGEVHAQDLSCSSSWTVTSSMCPDEGQAYAAANAAAQSWAASQGADYKGCVVSTPTAYLHEGFVAPKTANCSTWAFSNARRRTYPPGQTCSARANRYGGWQAEGATACDRGCMMQVVNPPIEKDTIETGYGIEVMVRAQYGSTGAICPDSVAPPPKHDYCVDLPMGHKICRNSNGDNCVISGSTGRKYCPKASNPSVNPNRTEGATQSNAPNPAPPPTPREGENWENQESATTTNTKGGTTTTNNTTIVNNTGNPNTTPGAQQPGDGSSNPGTGPGEGEGEEGPTAGGGGTCDAPPTCSDNSATCAILLQTWTARCEGHSPQLAGFDIDATLADMDAAVGGIDDDVPEGQGGMWDDAEDPLSGAREVRDENWMLSKIDDSRFMSGSCPTIEPATIGGLSIPFDLTPLCTLLGNMSFLVLGLAYFLAFRIMAGGS